MKNLKIPLSVLLGMSALFLFPISVSANSSWRWISETRPHDVLPFVILLTLVIEIFSICYFTKQKKLFKPIIFVILGNLLSFAAPYLLLYIIPSLYTFEQALEHTPFYIVGFAYLIITLAVEVPIVYFSLKKSSNTKRLLFTIISANIITTMLTAIIERIFCRGSW